jgi:uncharacterized membrane protein (Fun14 family)
MRSGMATASDTAMRFLVALIAGPMIGWALGYFIRKSIKIIAFIGGMFFFIIGVLYYSKTINNLSVLRKGVEDTLETAVNRTTDIANQALADSAGDLSIPLFTAGLMYPTGFLDAWHNTIEKREEDEICANLLAFLERMFRRINEHESKEIRKWIPTKSSDLELVSRQSEQNNSVENSDFCCTQCGINHEARDFVRAAMLHLIDHLEKNDNFIRFMKQNQFINQEIYHNMIARKAGKFKEPGMKINV